MAKREEAEVKFHVQILQQCLPELVQDLDVHLVLDYIGRKEIFHPIKIRDIRDLNIKSQMTRTLVQYLMESDEQSYKKFKECLEEAGQPQLKNSLEDIEIKTARSKDLTCIDLTKDEDHDSYIDLSCFQGADDASVITISSLAEAPAQKTNSVRIKKYPTLQLRSSLRPAVNRIRSLSKGSLKRKICACPIAKNNIKRKMKPDGRNFKMIKYLCAIFIEKPRKIIKVFFKNTVKNFYNYYLDL